MAETPPKEEKKSSKKLILIIAIVVLLLGAAGGGYFFFMHKSADPEHGEKAGEEKKAEEEHKEDAEHKEVAEPEVYYELPSPLLVNFPPGASAKVIKISLTVLLTGEASVAAMKKHEPMIRNNLLMTISSIGAEKAKTAEGKLELRALMLSEIGKVLEKMAGKNTAKDVYFTDFVMQ
jgi:flagellar protein FliL